MESQAETSQEDKCYHGNLTAVPASTHLSAHPGTARQAQQQHRPPTSLTIAGPGRSTAT